MRILKLTEESKKNILEDLLKRSPNQYRQYESVVDEVIENIRENGDEAANAYTKKFDGAVITPETIRVTENEIREAYECVEDSFIGIIRKAKQNIETYHQKQSLSTKQ